jgi:uncharacterized membrane protein (DUF4010 family)
MSAAASVVEVQDFAAAAGSLAVALGIGLALGIERERHKRADGGHQAAGVRTFALVALLGGLCVRLESPALLAVGGVFVGAAAIAGYVLADHKDPGLTTEVALMVAFVLGALAQPEPGLAAAATAAVGLMLASRSRLHRLARETLSEQEIRDGLLFAAAALIVLPLVPDRAMGPSHAFNPFTVWRLVVLVMAVNAVGHVALRALGPRIGLPAAGFVGGFVSSTATIGAMGRRAAQRPDLLGGYASAGIASTVATIVFTALVLGATSRATLRELAVPLVAAGVAALGYALVFAARGHPVESDQAPPGRAFDPRSALVVALTISILLVITRILDDALGRPGALLAIGVAGFADAQSAAVSAAALVTENRMSAADAAVCVLVGLSTNTVSKAVLARSLGGRAYATRIVAGLLLVLAAAWGAWAAQALAA